MPVFPVNGFDCAHCVPFCTFYLRPKRQELPFPLSLPLASSLLFPFLNRKPMTVTSAEKAVFYPFYPGSGLEWCPAITPILLNTFRDRTPPNTFIQCS